MASGFRCKWDGHGSGSMVMLGDGADVFGAVVVLGGSYGGRSELPRRVEQGTAQVLQ